MLNEENDQMDPPANAAAGPRENFRSRQNIAIAEIHNRTIAIGPRA